MAKSGRPKLRCPACGTEFIPPAAVCPDCGVDLRTGLRPKKGPVPSDGEPLKWSVPSGPVSKSKPTARPKLRCPACGAELTPPVSSCPACGVDMRFSYLKRKRRRPLWAEILIGAQFCLLAALGVWLLKSHWRGEAPNEAPAFLTASDRPPVGLLTPEAKREAISAAPAEFQRLAEENPLLLLPYIYVYRGKTAVQNYQDQYKARYSQIEELTGLSQDFLTFQKATPAQRQQILQELFDNSR